jgi:hypothetical protein
MPADCAARHAGEKLAIIEKDFTARVVAVAGTNRRKWR